MLLVKAHLLAELIEELRLAFSGSCPAQSGQQPLGIPRRPKEMGRFHEAGQFVRGDHRDFFVSFAADDYDLVVVGYTVKNRSQVLAQAGVRSFGHAKYCTGMLYGAKAAVHRPG